MHVESGGIQTKIVLSVEFWIEIIDVYLIENSKCL